MIEHKTNFTVIAPVRPPVLVAGKPILSESGVACQGTAGAQSQTVT